MTTTPKKKPKITKRKSDAKTHLSNTVSGSRGKAERERGLPYGGRIPGSSPYPHRREGRPISERVTPHIEISERLIRMPKKSAYPPATPNHGSQVSQVAKSATGKRGAVVSQFAKSKSKSGVKKKATSTKKAGKKSRY